MDSEGKKKKKKKKVTKEGRKPIHFIYDTVSNEVSTLLARYRSIPIHTARRKI